MSGKNDSLSNGIRSIPQVYFDFIARLIPGIITIASISMAVIGPGKLCRDLKSWLNSSSWAAIATFSVLILLTSYTLAMLLWCVFSWLRTKVLRQEYWDDGRFVWCYENIKSRYPTAGMRITKLKAQIHMTETLTAAFALSSLMGFISFLCESSNLVRLLFSGLLLLAMFASRNAAKYFVRHMKASLINNLNIVAHQDGKPSKHSRLVVLFDFDGTLVDLNKKEAYESVVETFRPGPDPNLAKTLCRLDSELCMKGEYDRREVFREHADKFEGGDTVQLCKAFWVKLAHAQKVKPGCRETLKILKDDGCVLACVTGSDGFGGDKKERIEATGLNHFFDEIFIGGDNGLPRKGSDAYMKLVVDKLASYMTPWVMVGDKTEGDLVPAERLGMLTVLVKNPEYPGSWNLEIASLLELIPIVRELKLGI